MLKEAPLGLIGFKMRTGGRPPGSALGETELTEQKTGRTLTKPPAVAIFRADVRANAIRSWIRPRPMFNPSKGGDPCPIVILTAVWHGQAIA